MNANTLFQTGLFIVVLIALAIPIGRYMTVRARRFVCRGSPHRPPDRSAACTSWPASTTKSEMSWKHYAFAVLAFNALGALVVFGFLRAAAVAAVAIRKASVR